MTRELSSTGKAKYLLLVHLIFVVKYRKKLLKKYGDEVNAKMIEISTRSNFEIDTIEVDADHIHLLVSYEPHISISQIVRVLKGETTHGFSGAQTINTRMRYAELSDTKGNWAPYVVRHSTDENGRDVFYVFHQAHKIASAVLSSDRTSVTDVSVQPEHQHRGVATALYRYIEGELGYRLKPSSYMTDAGKALWSSHTRDDV